MNLSIFGTDILTNVLDVISQALAIPVIVILLIIIIITVLFAGGFISECLSRIKVPFPVLKNLIYNINNANSSEDVKNIINEAEIPKSQKFVLCEIANSDNLNKNTREAFSRKLVEIEEENIDKTLEKTDIITRIGPTLGLMGTLIPMGPGLAALGSGDIITLAQSLTVAFNTTIVGIGSGAVCYIISRIRRRWYEEYLSTLDSLSDCVLDYMNK